MRHFDRRQTSLSIVHPKAELKKLPRLNKLDFLLLDPLKQFPPALLEPRPKYPHLVVLVFLRTRIDRIEKKSVDVPRPCTVFTVAASPVAVPVIRVVQERLKIAGPACVAEPFWARSEVHICQPVYGSEFLLIHVGGAAA